MRRRWRCFHCDEVFTRDVDAAEHFGGTQGALVGCQIKGHEHTLLGIIRKQEDELAAHRNDDSQIMRAMMTLQGEVEDRVRRAEDIGFGRGVREMQVLAEKQFGAPVVV